MRPSQWLSAISLLALAAMLVLAGAGLSPAAPAAAWAAPVDPQVYADLAAAPDGQATFIVLMAEQADLSGAEKISDWNDRGRYVYDMLRKTAARAQAPLLVANRAAAIPGQISEVQPLWIVNAVVAHGDLRAAEALARQPGVAQVLPEVKMAPLADNSATQVVATTPAKSTSAGWSLAGTAPVPSLPKNRLRTGTPFQLPGLFNPQSDTCVPTSADDAWGVIKVGAPAAWADPYDATGQGIVIGVVDTGVKWDHPALKEQYRGWNAGDDSVVHDYNWYNPAGLCDDAATGTCDADTDTGAPIGHGTHVTGIAVGYEAPDRHIGVAPGAQWIHAVACVSNDCPTAAVLASLQWMLAPTDLTGQNPDTTRRPNVVNNSWGGSGGSVIFENAVAALRAAGIEPVFAAGNSGSLGCGSLNSPGDNPPAFNVGSVNPPWAPPPYTDSISTFSSRGSNPFTGGIGPQVVAPGGGGICSSEATGGYGSSAGTSMAAPHVTGAVAVLLSAAPALIGQVDQVEEILRRTAAPLTTTSQSCGGVPGTQVPNNTFGWGRLDVLAAVQMVWQAGTLNGVITDAGTGLPIAGATVSITRNDDTLTQATDAAGHYSFVAGAGTYEVKAEAFGYTTQTVSDVSVSQDATTAQDFALGTLSTGSITGFVSEAESGVPPKPVAGATVALVSSGLSTTTDDDGSYTLAAAPFGAHTVRMTSRGYQTLSAAVTVDGAETLDFTPAAAPDFVIGDGGDSCSVEYAWVDATDGTPRNLGDDAYISATLPWAFPFYGNTYSSVSVNANGFVSFGQNYSSWHGIVPFEGPPNNQIIGLGSDLNPAGGGQGVVYTKDLGDGRFVIAYDQVQHFPSGDPETFEIILHLDGTIVTQYHTLSWPDSTNSGVENADGSRGILYSYANHPPLVAGLAVKFTPFSGQPPTCARAAAPLAEITVDGATAELRWQDVAPNQEYEIWRDAAPYFEPPLGDWLDTVPATPGEMIYPDTRPDGEPPANRFYLVRGRVAGVPSGPSNRVGEFVFALTPGN